MRLRDSPAILLELLSTVSEAGYVPSFRKGISPFQCLDIPVGKQPTRTNERKQVLRSHFIRDDICICFYSCKHTLFAAQWQPLTAGEHAAWQIRTKVFGLVRDLGGLAEGQRVVLVRQLRPRAGELHSLEEEQKDYPRERTQ